MEGRWTMVLGSGGELLAAHEGTATEDYEGLTPVGAVPCDGAAIGRAVAAVQEERRQLRGDVTIEELVEIAFRAAGETR